jgi:hypothetical protein
MGKDQAKAGGLPNENYFTLPPYVENYFILQSANGIRANSVKRFDRAENERF